VLQSSHFSWHISCFVHIVSSRQLTHRSNVHL
jgi:hypothetical protein